MYLFKSQFTLVAYPNLDFLILLTGLALLLLVINYLISLVSIRHSYG
jgi:hypothetical protein